MNHVFDCYFFVFYGATFLLNFVNILTLLIPFQVAELIAGVGGWTFLASQFVILFYLTYLYSIIYVVNDVVDFRSDVENKVVKSSLIVRHKSVLVSWPFLLLVALSFVVAFGVSPKLGPYYLAYSAYLVLLSLGHSLWPRVKPATFFVERSSRFLAPSLFIFYDTKPQLLTLTFVLACIVTYPIVMHREYMEYLEGKRKLGSRARWVCAWIYSLYFLIFLFVLPFTVVTTNYLRDIRTSALGVLVDTILAVITLVAFRALVNAGARRASELNPQRWSARLPFLSIDRRFLLIKTTVLTSLTALTLVVAYAK